MLQKRWNIKEKKDDFTVETLAESLNISEILARLLVQRNIKSFNEAKLFFRPSLEYLHDPFLMDGMETATHRLIKALTENEKITIYGDYDVDGTCATSVLYLFLKALDANVGFYIPKRLTEGYGISKQGIDLVKERGTSLLISVDCGITAIEEIDYANQLGMEVIICDHHKPKEEIPNALAVLDPLKPNCNYPFKYLCGAGVAFKLAQGLAERIGKRDMPLEYLDLVALASAADIVSLTDENRIIVNEGIKLINESPRPALEALIKAIKNLQIDNVKELLYYGASLDINKKISIYYGDNTTADHSLKRLYLAYEIVPRFADEFKKLDHLPSYILPSLHNKDDNFKISSEHLRLLQRWGLSKQSRKYIFDQIHNLGVNIKWIKILCEDFSVNASKMCTLRIIHNMHRYGHNPYEYVKCIIDMGTTPHICGPACQKYIDKCVIGNPGPMKLKKDDTVYTYVQRNKDIFPELFTLLTEVYKNKQS